MAISSIHIEKGHIGYMAHNSRENPTKNSIFEDEPNYFSCSSYVAIKQLRELIKDRSEKYKERTGQKVSNKTLLHLSSIINLNAEHTEKDIKINY